MISALDAHSPQTLNVPGSSVSDQPERARGRRICCVACRAPVTDSAARIEVDGKHEHTFFNPAGVVFTVVVFAAAPGCRGVGPFSSEFTWFAGQRWQIGVCAACGQHLGWHFAGEQQFTALIAQRIEECPLAGNG